MGGEENDAAAARHGGPQMLGALDMHEAGEARGREPPGERYFQHGDPQTREVPIEQLFTRPRGQFGKTQLEVASCRFDEAGRQSAQHRAQRSSDRYHHPERQQRHDT